MRKDSRPWSGSIGLYIIFRAQCNSFGGAGLQAEVGDLAITVVVVHFTKVSKRDPMQGR